MATSVAASSKWQPEKLKQVINVHKHEHFSLSFQYIFVSLRIFSSYFVYVRARAFGSNRVYARADCGVRLCHYAVYVDVFAFEWTALLCGDCSLLLYIIFFSIQINTAVDLGALTTALKTVTESSKKLCIEYWSEQKCLQKRQHNKIWMLLDRNVCCDDSKWHFIVLQDVEENTRVYRGPCFLIAFADVKLSSFESSTPNFHLLHPSSRSHYRWTRAFWCDLVWLFVIS